MASMVGDLFVVLRAETAPFRRSMADAAVSGESFTTKMGGLGRTMSRLGKATTAVGIGVAVASVKMASDFQAQMTRLQTAAGLTQQQLKQFGTTTSGLNSIVLKLGSQVGFTGTQMAEALYHPISAGLDLKSALEVVKYAAEEAKISGANLEDTTYSLSSVMKAFNLPAEQAKQTMASLNAIVGQGDMRFQDFNQSVKNWAPTAAQMGISINSMGAGLAYLTDRGNSAEVAATRMTMGISMMTTPSAKATKMLTALGVASTDVKASSDAMQKAMQDSGITQNKLAADLKKPDGLYVALNDLKTSLEKAGVSGTEADSVLSKIFGGGRSDKAIMSLMQNLDGLKGKFNDISKASAPKNFDAAWQQTQQTFKVQMDKMKASAENLGISLGLKLIPVLQKMFAFLSQHKDVAMALAEVIGGVLAAAVLKFATGAVVGAVKGVGDIVKGVGAAAKAVKAFAESEKLAALATRIMTAAQAALDAVMDANPIFLIIGALVLLGVAFYELWTHVAGFRNFWIGLWHDIQSAAMSVWHALQTAWNAIVAGVTWLWQRIQSTWHTIQAVTTVVWNAIAGFFRKWWPLLLVIFLPFVAIIMAIWNHFHTQIIGTAKTVWNAVSSFFVGIWHGIEKLALVLFQAVYNNVVKPMQAAWHFIEAVWNAAKPYLLSAWHWIANQANSAFQAMKRNIINPITEAWHWITQRFNDIKNYVSSKLAEAVHQVQSIASRFADVGSAIVHGIIHGVESAGGALFSSLKNLANGALNAAKSFLGINSPSKVFADHVGLGIAEGVAKGVDDNTHVAVRSVRSMAASLAGVPVGAPAAGGLALAAGGYGGAAGGPTVVNYITVQGSVLTERDLRDLMQREFLRLGARSSTTYQNYQR